MLRGLGPCSFALLALLLAGEAAATIIAEARGCYSNSFAQQCLTDSDSGAGAMASAVQNLPIPGGIFGGQAGMAVADFDQWGADARASIDYVSGPPDLYGVIFHAAGARALAELSDTLLVTGAVGSGTVRMQWEITGGNDIGFVGSDPVLVVNARTDLVLECFAQSGASFLNCPDHQFTWMASGVVGELVTVDVPIVFGTPLVWTFQIRLAAGLSFQSEACTEACVTAFQGHADADFSSTGDLINVQLFDGSFTELDPGLIQAQSGFRYDLVGSSVPEPLALVGVGPLLLAARLRRRT
jgi:hypothetical protein